MLTLNTILEEIKDVPVNRLEELHLFIKTLVSKKEDSDWWDEISDTEKELIEEGLKDIEEGRMISHEDFLKSYGR
ncbi:hypothetical protein [Epilithonimonas xixisoli]|uniref:Uncharacterized protein n=1 Tax=Epilithonimonas xixisoli TaxID=1476462 RepID=A0A4R8I5W1_9FLAO|nr:hypothetical protein [Epilithonimonas xixisoli]TDX84317.1 hypothetical protein B0I22_1929 [Epilithonimonas xixisoli]